MSKEYELVFLSSFTAYSISKLLLAIIMIYSMQIRYLGV